MYTFSKKKKNRFSKADTFRVMERNVLSINPRVAAGRLFNFTPRPERTVAADIIRWITIIAKST